MKAISKPIKTKMSHKLGMRVCPPFVPLISKAEKFKYPQILLTFVQWFTVQAFFYPCVSSFVTIHKAMRTATRV
jgi:hypothetical protein